MAESSSASALGGVLEVGAVDRSREAPCANVEEADAPDILTVLSTFGTGGVERVTCLLMNGFARQGLLVQLAAVKARGPLRQLVRANVDAVEIGCKRWLPGRSLGLIAAIPRLIQRLRVAPPAVLLSPGNHTHVATAIAHRLAGSSRTRLVVKITNPLLKNGHGWIARFVRTAFYRWVFARADRILVISRQGERQIEQIWPAAKAKTAFVHNPYIDDAPAKLPAVTAVRSVRTILSVGRLTAQKNHALLLRALARLTNRSWHLVVLGEGPLEASLRKLAAELGIADRVAFKGFVPDTSPFYRDADLLALPSKWEDLPAVALEALAAGIPVVATRCSEGLVDIVDKAGHGQLVPVDDIDAFTNALDEWLGRPAKRAPFAGAERYGITNGVKDHLAAILPMLEVSPRGTPAGAPAIDTGALARAA